LAYCTVIFRTPCVIVITAAITMIKKNTSITSTIGFTWLDPLCADGTKVFHACASAAGKRATMPMVMMRDIPLPMPRSVI